MTTATHTRNGRLARSPVAAPGTLVPPRPSALDQLGLACVFADTVVRYVLRVLPQVSSELSQWRARAAEIPDPQLRRTARAALAKRGNIEGAALFATLASAAHRRRTVRALVAFQTAYNYLDALSEIPGKDPIANGEQLHRALLTALHPGAPHIDYYAHNAHSEDGGYLRSILDACRDAVAHLPSYPALAPTARVAAARIVEFQALNLSELQGGHSPLQRWATEATPAGSGLAWWETAAAAGSSLAVHALIAAAANPHREQSDASAIDRAYFPSIGALHSLLDSLVDRAEDRGSGQRSLLDYYRSSADAAIQLAGLATRARRATEVLPSPHAHRVILTAMCSYYLSAPECDTAEAWRTTAGLAETLGLPLNIAIRMFRSRRLLHVLARRKYT
jgi:tetraprenyl-beta-curcumene synthase